MARNRLCVILTHIRIFVKPSNVDAIRQQTNIDYHYKIPSQVRNAIKDYVFFIF